MVNVLHGRAGRYRQIVSILASYGFSELLTELNPGELRLVERIRYGRLLDQDRPARPSRSERRAVRLRLAIEELGPTFIKLGQILSTRADLLPPDIVRELTRLQDTVRPAPFPQITRVIESELDADIGELFASIDEEPLGSASIGQVYAATLPDGTPVVVKVQRPGFEAVVAGDIAILRRAARLLGAAASCSLRSSLVSASGKRSVRPEIIWPSLTKVGPSSSSTSRKRRASLSPPPSAPLPPPKPRRSV